MINLKKESNISQEDHEFFMTFIEKFVNRFHDFEGVLDNINFNDEMNIKELTEEDFDMVINSRDPRGKFIYKNPNGVFLALDNSSGDAWLEEFETLLGAYLYLIGCYPDEVHKIEDNLPNEKLNAEG